jgi:uncharacterized protein YjcR
MNKLYISDEMIKELKKTKSDIGENYDTTEEEWEFQFAWDRQFESSICGQFFYPMKKWKRIHYF